MDSTTSSNSLIAASRVNGTAVYNAAGESIGSIYDLMIEKVSGRVAYAIMSFGGFLGLGDSYHPLPWSQLKYDTNLGGYVTNVSKEMLQRAPSYESGSEPAWGDPNYNQQVYGYYGQEKPFWD